MKIDLSNRSKKLLSLTFIVFVMVVACVKQDIQPIPQTAVKVRDLDRVLKAIEWLNNELPPNTKSTTEWIPLWESAFTEESNSSQTVEVPLTFFKEYMFVLPECNAKYIQTKDPKYIQNITHMIVETNPKTGETRGYFMSVVPSLKYLEKTNFKFDKNSYLSRDSQFDGYIIFKDIQGNLVNGWVYSNGKITSSLKPASSNVPPTKSGDDGIWNRGLCATYFVDYSMNVPSINPIGSIPNPPDLSNLCLKISGCQSSIGDYQGGAGGAGGTTDPDDGIIYDEQSLTLIKPAVDKIKQNCGGAALLNALASMGINFKYVSGQSNMLFSTATHTISYYLLGEAYQTQVIHELIHAYQHMNSSGSLTSLNKEIEAFFGMYKYASKYGLVDSELSYKWSAAFQPYLNSPTPENYALMSDFVKNYGNGDYASLPDTESLRNTSNVDVLFNCN